jgi:hypothetical protein
LQKRKKIHFQQGQQSHQNAKVLLGSCCCCCCIKKKKDGKGSREQICLDKEDTRKRPSSSQLDKQKNKKAL